MDSLLLKRKINSLINDNNSNNNDYANILALEKSLIRLMNDTREKIHELSNIIGNVINEECEVEIYDNEKYDVLIKSKSINILLRSNENNPVITIKNASKIDKELFEKLKDLFNDNDRVRIIIDDYYKYMKLCDMYINIETNLGVYLNMFISLNDIVIHLVDSISKYTTLDILKSGDDKSFIYSKDLITNEVDFANFNNSEEDINKELFDNIYNKIRVDINILPSYVKEIIKNNEYILSKKNIDITLDNEEKLKMDRVKKAKAYSYLKEALRLLEDTNKIIDFDKIRVNNIEELILNDNGKYKEFIDYFKNNKILRMLDLSMIDLNNVDIRGIDFSNTNIHINPQVIYNKDLSNCNLTNVKFSPFTDLFDDTILDGTIINDHEVNIDLLKVRSYNDKTKITKEVVEDIRKSR